MEQQHETYYVPEQSKLPILASIGLFLTVFGLANWLNDVAADKDGSGALISLLGFILLSAVLFNWFASVIDENMKGLNSAQVKRSYVWGMGWFIFSEVMFFSAFFGALWYLRNMSLPLLSEGPTSELLWNGFKADWPLMTTPDMAANGAAAVVNGPDQNMSNPGVSNWAGWLPFWNTAVLLISSFTVHFAHTALKKDDKKKFNIWLGITVALGFIFLVLQVEEYLHAYNHMGLTLETGVYGTTFFMLTGFHGLHVTMGTFMLLVQWLRSISKGHFSHADCFGFEASSWYWHFVDVVWVGLFLFVYILG
ncbi:cytochrome c oxidase subunit 3 [Teredinibacter purpureus]|jgi:Heme/copper-type cytochrome/quinol oxidase, subunit 3|uniref:cytochrome c oxidase subunit 3 n=1 Tax=Teredinibacter purpureus TaxID=2731756 RepID=UPI0005F77016|nr:cytochrome c oxidase subunit 3 [Teredinibacter purpureus]